MSSSTLTTTTRNLSILSIPAYYVLSVLPHTYAVLLASRGQPTKWDNRNPRSSSLKSRIQENLGPDLYAKYERAEAAHANGIENLPIFAAAMVVGNMARLKGLERIAGIYLALRAIYSVVYIQTSDNRFILVRTGLWAASLGVCFDVFRRAAESATILW